VNDSHSPFAPTLTDAVIRLDGLTLADAAAHLAGEDEEQARRFGWYPKRSTEEQVRAFIVRQAASWRDGGPTRVFATRLVETGVLAGGCEIRLKGAGLAEMSYWTFPARRGQGLARRAVLLACAYTFAELRVQRIELHVAPDNLASRGVARAAGFAEVEEFFPDEEARAGGQPMVRYALDRPAGSG
jgi:RimJ/RimL family protein N-acetyltransferase